MKGFVAIVVVYKEQKLAVSTLITPDVTLNSGTNARYWGCVCREVNVSQSFQLLKFVKFPEKMPKFGLIFGQNLENEFAPLSFSLLFVPTQS